MVGSPRLNGVPEEEVLSELVHEVFELGDTSFEPLSLSDLLNELTGLGGGFKWICIDHFPMVEHTLGEGSS